MTTQFFEAKSIDDLCALLGLPASQAPKVAMRRDLVVAIRKSIEMQQLTHAAAAKIAGIGRTVITAIVNGNIDKISTDRLIDVAHAFGLSVSLKIKKEIHSKTIRHTRTKHHRSKAAALR